ncbi:hypothetical protein [Roseibium salinum]|uniref:Uncharacterized protein n=1 Tax=Roseibium salinum TaxID=1604349 RepID=A0ABT3R7F5_9HYPH|nr:hypothetical protein [Roseibium sp. DSM 29163]MCX2725229.1 hypothetical protein [Roseibium sp. DSM 29163]
MTATIAKNGFCPREEIVPDSRPDANVRPVYLGIFAEDMKHSEYGIPAKTAYFGGSALNRAPTATASFCEQKAARAGRLPPAGPVQEAA